MSLVGSLEDLGLGDILQIVSLSRKSGVLQLRSGPTDGRIVLRDGLICAAVAKGAPQSLRDLLVGGNFVSATAFDAAEDKTRRAGTALDDALAEESELTAERLAVIRREHVKRTVVEMFAWTYGEFSFEVGGKIDDRDTELHGFPPG